MGSCFAGGKEKRGTFYKSGKSGVRGRKATTLGTTTRFGRARERLESKRSDDEVTKEAREPGEALEAQAQFW